MFFALSVSSSPKPSKMLQRAEPEYIYMFKINIKGHITHLKGAGKKKNKKKNIKQCQCIFLMIIVKLQYIELAK